MNQSFKSLWNESAGAYVAAPETAKASGSHTSSSRKASRALGRSPTQRLALEPRIVFDGALPIAVIDTFDSHVNEQHVAEVTSAAVAQNTVTLAQQPAEKDATKDTAKATETSATSEQITPQERPLIDGTLAPTNLTSHEIIFIDAFVADLQQYIAEHPNADVVLLDSTKDALDQIATTLSGRTDISAIHILSHGASGVLEIGNGILSIDNLTSGSHTADLAIIKSAMTENGDILIYGCNVGAGAYGQAFIDALAANTGADIAASLDKTGAANLGGNWNLETHTAQIDAQSLDLAAWNGDLVYSNTFAGGAWTFTNAAANGGTAATATTATNTTDGVTTTVTFSGSANAWTGTAVQTLNNIAAFANGAQNTADFTTTFAGGVTGTVTITFSKPVINPIIHIDRIGGSSGTTSNSSLWTLTTAGATLTKLNGSSSLLVGGAAANGSTGTTIQRQTGFTMSGSATTESSLTNNLGTAAGSIQVAGTYTTLTFNVTGAADGLEFAFAFDAPPTTNNDAFVINEDTTLSGNLFANNGSGADLPYTDPVKINTINGAAFTVGTPITLASGILTITDATTGAFTFVPNANYNGTQAFTYDVKEINTTGTPLPGTGVGNVSNTATATITINSSNDAPVGTDKTITTVEDTPISLTVADFGFSDPNDTPANAFASVKITTLPTTGTLKLSGVAVTAGQIVTAANIPNLTWTPALNSNGTALSNFTFQVIDNGGVANGGQDTDQSANTITFNVTSINDAPAGTDKTITTNEDTAVSLSAADFGFTDASDTPANAFANVIITTLPTTGTLRLSGVAVTVGQVVTQANIVNLTWTPALNTNSTALSNFTFQVVDDGGVANGGQDTDQSANTITFNVSSVNDAPAGTDKTVTIIEDNPYIITVADFGFTDLDGNAFTNVIVTSRPPAAEGVYLLNGVAITTGQVISVIDINTGKLTFNPTLNKNGTTIGALGFKVQDNGGTSNGGVDADPTANTLNFNITAVNDAPTVSLPATGVLTTVEDTPLILSSITLADVDATTGSESVTVTIGAGQGVLNWTITPFVSVTNNGTGSITLSGQINAIRNAITTGNALSYAPTADFNGTATLTVTINDNGNTGTGGALSATATTNITVTPVADVVNDAVTTSEDTPITFNVLTNLPANGASADNFENVAAAVTATSTPAHGSVTFNAAGSLAYTPTAGYNGTDTFTYTVTSGGVTETATVTVTINSVNDAPTGANNTAPATEDVPYTVTAANFGFADLNDTPAMAKSLAWQILARACSNLCLRQTSTVTA
jgi:VCBS repeat-containing protein